MKKWLGCLGLVLSASMVFAAPVLELNVNVAAWLDSYTDAVQTNDASATFQTLGITNVAVAALVDQDKVAVFSKIETSHPDARTAWLSHTNLVLLEALSENDFKWIQTRKKSAPTLDPTETLRVRFSGNAVMIAEENHFSDAEALNATLAGEHLAYGTVRLAPLIEPLFMAAEKMIAGEEEGFGKAIMTGMLDTLKSYTTSLREISSVGINVTSMERDRRRMSLTLEFAQASSAGDTKAFFDDSSEAWKDPAVTKIQLGLASLVDTPHFQTLALDGSNLEFSYQWNGADYRDILETVGRALVDSLFSFGDSSKYPLYPEETIAAPNIESAGEFDAAKVEESIRSALFLNQVWSQQLEFVVDHMDLPNMELMEASLTNVVVLGTNGANIARAKNPGSFRLTRITNRQPFP